jgi:gamma-glutamylcyclotransferase (GGCT)/AIG2-like uncharacterized protein YtfP
MDYLFVYGTLLKQFDNEVLRPLKAQLQLAGQGLLKGKLYDLGQYPGYVEDALATGTVKGEVYHIEDAETVFSALDKYEGIEYSRKKKLVRLGDNKNIRCWVYVYQQKISAEHKRIMNGDYIVFYRNKVNNG